MPEQDYDRLEQFFRKAAAKADVTFNEDDWKKLEARLDAGEGDPGAGKKAGIRGATATVIAVVVSLSVSVWLASDSQTPLASGDVATVVENSVERGVEAERLETSSPNATTDIPAPEVGEPLAFTRESDSAGQVPQTYGIANTHEPAEEHPRANPQNQDISLTGNVPAVGHNTRKIGTVNRTDTASPGGQVSVASDEQKRIDDINLPSRPSEEGHADVARNIAVDENALETLERNKQKAVVELPGAEEDETREAPAMVQEEHASDKKKHVATPRLSLLLSFAPDFSGTSMTFGPSVGKAFGGMIHYHPFRRWSISAGVIRNYKVYTGAGEDYKPPKNYWKYYTNGVIPETIDGSCSIVEFPVMIQYTAVQTPTGRVNVALGASSYLMESESYQYNFSHPNPGARDRWDSRGSSHFVFNMLNFTIGYERQIIPGFMLGIEPYVKIPLEEIGWSNLKLFSSGASFTLRYTILRRNKISVTTRARGPD